MHRLIRRLGFASAGAVLAVLAVSGLLVAQQPVIGIFSRIYLGGTSVTFNPQIRWGSSAPSGSCAPGSLYLQSAAATVNGPGWFCQASGTWVQVASSTQLGNEFYANASTFGAKCDGSTDDTVALQGAVDAAYVWGKSGKVVLPPGSCQYSAPLVVGPITNPWQQSPTGAGWLPNVTATLNAPRSATVSFTASSTTITWTGSTITSADVGNFVFYGPYDTAYQAVGENLVLQPTYGCTITALLSSTSATCVPTTYAINDGVVPNTTTTGSQSVFITDDHHLTITDSNSLTSDNLNKSVTFAVATLRAPLDCLTLPCTNRPGPHDALEPYNTPSPCVGGSPTDDWQCFNGGNVKLRYFTGVVTDIGDGKHITFTLASTLSGGSNALYNFPATSRGDGAYSVNEWAVNDADGGLIARNPHFDHFVDFTATTDYLQASSGGFTFLAYQSPVDTAQRYISIAGASEASSVLNFLGCPDTGQWVNACAALILSRNKYFSLEDFSVNNASGSDTDDATQWGIYFGGLPSGGTECLEYTINRVGVAGFGVDVKIGDFVGGEASDATYNQLTLNNGGFGTVINGANTLDILFNDLSMGFNKVGVDTNFAGNVFIRKGSASFDDIDFMQGGFGPFAVSDYRSEGVGIPIVGQEPSSKFDQMNIAEPAATRAITGDVAAAPNSTRDLASLVVSNVSTGSPTGSFFPVSFPADTFTGADERKVLLLPGLGIGGNPAVTEFWSLLSSTTGTVYCLGVTNCVATSGTVTGRIYDNALADLTFPANAITAFDVGASVQLPNATVAGNGSGVRCLVTSVSSSTAGQCGWFLGNQGQGPVITGTTTNPVVFVNTAAYGGGYGATYTANLFSTGRIVNSDMGHGHYTLVQNKVLALGPNPVTMIPNGPRWELGVTPQMNEDDILAALPTPTSAISSGLAFPWTLQTGVIAGASGLVTVTSVGNTGSIYGDANDEWTLPDGSFSVPNFLSDVTSLVQSGIQNFGSPLNPFILQKPSAPVGTVQQLARVKTFGEGVYANGQNLRQACSFGPVPGTPSAALAGSGSGNVNNGTHEYYVTFVGPAAIDISSAGSVNVADHTSDGKVSVTSIATGPTGTTARKVWRTSAGTSGLANAKLLTTISDNVTTSYTDNTADGSLGTSAPTTAVLTCPFQRSEGLTVVGPDNFNSTTYTWTVAVTSGHFTADDVGKVLHVATCCGDGAASDFWGTISSIVDGTHITVFASPGTPSFPDGTTTPTATVGLNEPDANWLPTGLTCTAVETFSAATPTTAGLTIQSSNTQSTATCRVLVVR